MSPTESSAGNTRGLIEALGGERGKLAPGRSSAGNTRGLIEAVSLSSSWIMRGCLPRGIPAASLKPELRGTAWPVVGGVFRGEYPRPH